MQIGPVMSSVVSARAFLKGRNNFILDDHDIINSYFLSYCTSKVGPELKAKLELQTHSNRHEEVAASLEPLYIFFTQGSETHLRPQRNNLSWPVAAASTARHSVSVPFMRTQRVFRNYC